MDEKTDLLDLSLEEFHQFLTDIGYEEFRAKQITIGFIGNKRY